MVLHFKTCCCGCSLRTGALSIGIIYAITSLCGLIGSIWSASALSAPVPTMFNSLGDEVILKAEQTEDALHIISICLAVVCAVQLIMNILLVFGASAERPALVKPWLVTAIITTVTHVALSIALIASQGANGEATAAATGFVILTVGTALSVYFILVVNSFHTDLLKNNYQYKI